MAEKAAGIIAEYNPFHNGHLWQLRALREALGDVPVITCMSGFVVQRGELALTDPWARAEMAVRGGVDLVLALPAVYSLRSADHFAAGGVDLLAATGLVDTLVCSREAKNDNRRESAAAQAALLPAAQPADAETAARWALSSAAESSVRTFLQQGLPYAAAWEQAARRAETEQGYPGLADWFSGANTILTLAYQKRILQKKYPLTLLSLPRQGSSYNETALEAPYASASSIRAALATPEAAVPDWETIGQAVPQSTLSLLRKTEWRTRLRRREERLAGLLAGYLITHDSRYLYTHSSASKDLCRRFYNERGALAEGYASFIRRTAHKRDALPMVQRLAVQQLLNRNRDFWLHPQEPFYLRVLAFNDRGRQLLKEMKQTATLPLIVKLGREQRYQETPLYDQLRTDLAAADLFNLTDGRIGCYGEDFYRSPLYISDTQR